MDTKNTLIAIVLSAVISSICTATILITGKTTTSSGSVPAQASDLDEIESQLAQIKSALALETQARISLAQQLSNGGNSTAVVSGSVSQALTVDTEASPTLENDPQTQSWQQRVDQNRADRLASQQVGFRQQQLINSGFAREEADRIVQIESEESLRQLQAQYDRRRELAASNGDQASNINPIRAELGEQNYQRYLEANGWPTSASIGSVIGGSPGANVGLRAGDRVISYAGQRVFNLNEINDLTIQGQVGESVLIEVQRNGEAVQLTIPRGPIGIISGRQYRR